MINLEKLNMSIVTSDTLIHIIPSDIQRLAGNVTAIKELWKDDVPKA